jgi:hypothetical protein
MEKMLQSVLEKHNSEVELLKYKHKEELAKIEDLYKNKLLAMKTETSELNRIRWDESKKYFSIKDFCRNTRDLLFIKEDSLKQHYLSVGILKKENDKYVPNNKSAKLVENEVYVEYSQLRKLLAVRSMIFFDCETMDNILNTFRENSDIMTEQMGSTVYVDCRQRSEEFRNHRESIYFNEEKCAVNKKSQIDM